MHLGALLIVAMLLFACIAAPDSLRAPQGQLVVEEAPRRACLGADASWSSSRNDWVCAHHSTPDAGSPCTSSSECEGHCVADSEVLEGSQVVGVCSGRYTWPGCAQAVNDGVASATICE
jgi:hypothetical protein